MEKIEWQIEGMTCTNCAMTIDKFLQKQGAKQVKVDFIGGNVSFEWNENGTKEILAKGINDLGYKVVIDHRPANTDHRKILFSNHLQRFLFCLPFTLVLSLHMLPWHIHFLMNPWIQFGICIPVYAVGMSYFGKSAIKSLRRGIPNMNVLIAIGATAAFVYSLIGTIANLGPNYIYYETAATIITLVFLGEWIENRSVTVTQKELKNLTRQQKVMANMIAFDEHHQELIFPVENTQLHVGDLILIKSGEQVPSDCKILWGDAHVNESLLTGESKPVFKQKKDILIGGSLLMDGTIKAQVTAVGRDTVLSNILQMVKDAQAEKPPIQQLADKISAVFVPTVIGISVLTFMLNYFLLSINITHSIMRSIAVLVISCPCAMGLATPAAIAVGLGRAAKNGILFRNAKSLELFKNIQTVVFDKTGTLTKGKLSVNDWKVLDKMMTDEDFKKIVCSMEKYSNHPIAKAISNEWKTTNIIPWKKINEVKGFGIIAEDNDGNTYYLGSHKIAALQTKDSSHSAYLLKNNHLVGWLDMEDEIRSEAVEVVKYFHSKNIRTIVLSGDSKERTQKIAELVGINEVMAEKSPEEKLTIIEQFNKKAPVAMVGDGINDAPALAKATIGISMSEATQIAMQSAQVVLMNKGIQHLPLALGLGKHTFITIKQNLFWAFIYNIVAIPIAAMGYLHPGIAALAMGFSDVVLAINSIRLKYKKVA